MAVDRPWPRVAAAFATQRDAEYAVKLAAGIQPQLTFELKPVRNEKGETQMVVLEATCPDPEVCARVVTLMRGAHGIQVPVASDGE